MTKLSNKHTSLKTQSQHYAKLLKLLKPIWKHTKHLPANFNWKKEKARILKEKYMNNNNN